MVPVGTTAFLPSVGLAGALELRVVTRQECRGSSRNDGISAVGGGTSVYSVCGRFSSMSPTKSQRGAVPGKRAPQVAGKIPCQPRAL